MTTSIIDYFPKKNRITQTNKDKRSLSCQLLWRRNQLLVKTANYRNKKHISMLGEEKNLVDCLCHSPITLIRVDPQVGIEQLLFWANACKAANKPIYLYIPKGDNHSPIFNTIQQLINSLLACILLTLLMPLILPLILWIRLYSHQLPITYEWCVGRRGRLFKRIKFSTTNLSLIDEYSNLSISVSKIIQKYELDRIPELLNVIRGEMVLFGSTCWTLKDAIKLSLIQQK